MTAVPVTLTDAPAAPPNSARTALRLALLELRLLAREPAVAVSLIGFPAVTVLVLAGVFGQSPDPEFGGAVPSDHYIVGYIGVVLAALGLITLPVRLATYRELGVTRRFRASGLSGPVMVASEIILGAVLGTVSAAVVLAAGAAVYGLSMPEDPLPSSPGSSRGWRASSPSAAPSARCSRAVVPPTPSATCCSSRCSSWAAAARPATS